MPIVKNTEIMPAVKKPKKVGATVAGKKKTVAKIEDTSSKIKKKTNKVTVVAKKVKNIEKEKIIKKKTPVKKIIETNKTAKKVPVKKPKKINSKSSETKNDKITETSNSTGPKKLKSPERKNEKLAENSGAKKLKSPERKNDKVTETQNSIGLKKSKSPERKNEKFEIPTSPKTKKLKKDTKETKSSKRSPKEILNKTKKEVIKTPKKVATKTKKINVVKETEKINLENKVENIKVPVKKEPKTKKKQNEILDLKSPQSIKNELTKKVPSTEKKPPTPRTSKSEKLVKPEKIKIPKKPKLETENCKKPLKSTVKKSKLLKQETETKEQSIIENIIQEIADNCEKTKNLKKDKIIKCEDIDTNETIAKLLKEANKTLLQKGTSKKKREAIKLNKPNAVQKKSIKANKQKSKQVEFKQEYEEDADLSDIKQVAKIIKATKKNIKKDEKLIIKNEPEIFKPPEINDLKEKQPENDQNANTDDSTTSDELTLETLRQNHITEKKSTSPIRKIETPIKPTKKIKTEPPSDTDRKKNKPLKKIKTKTVRKIPQKKKMVIIKKCIVKKDQSDDQKGRKMKLIGFWNGPKRHRVASLNALAKVHCLYENESRGAMQDVMKRSVLSKDTKESISSDPEPISEPLTSTRTLRSVPGLRGVGKHWEMHDETSSSSDNDSSVDGPKKVFTLQPSYKQKQKEKEKKKDIPKVEEKIEPEIKEEKPKKKIVRKKRSRTELIMDLKDMVVRKRMASLNASAILAASYSVEKKPLRSPKSDETTSSDESIESVCSDKKRRCYDSDVKKEDDRKVIEVHASPNKKVAVILNQDTDVTITGVYVNSTTRSTHHEGYCSIAGMQYRISATSHTQTNATAVATETLIHSGSEHSTTEGPPAYPKSYTPLSALSSMQPPGGPVPTSGTLSPGGRRHGCPSAFSAPPQVYGPPPPPPPPPHHRHGPPLEHHPGTYMHGYYQPAGPLITHHPAAPGGPAVTSGVTGHGVTSGVPGVGGPPVAPPPGKPLEPSPSPTPPPTASAPSTGNESSDNEVIITSATSATSADSAPPPPHHTYRYPTYTAAPGGGAYAQYPGYGGQYYQPAPPPPPPLHYHDMCYPPPPPPGQYGYLHAKPYATTFRRYLPPPTGQYYTTAPELYPPPTNQPSTQVVSAAPNGSGGGSGQYPPPPGSGQPPPPALVDSYSGPPPPTIVETYAPPPPPPHYYAEYGAPPQGPCYTHQQPTRSLAFIDTTYQSCPCPMQSCPKNVHIGPLTGDGKRSNNTTSIAKESLPLPPVALALPLEPASIAGPPSPARGSAGMPPPPSPAGAVYQPEKQPESAIECKPEEKKRKARVGKTTVKNNLINSCRLQKGNLMQENTMLLMCHAPNEMKEVKREVESPEEKKTERIPDIQTKSEIKEIEVNNINNEVQNGLINIASQKLEGEDHKDQILPAESTPTRRKSIEISSPITENKVTNVEEKTTIKRKLEETKAPSEAPTTKKQKITTVSKSNYKNLIKKSPKTNNLYKLTTKRKLNDSQRPILKTSKTLVKKKTKRKLLSTKEEISPKKLKITKPLIASNFHNSKLNLKNKCDTENTELKKPNQKSKPVNSKKKLAPELLDSLFIKNNVDRTIESVVLNSVLYDEQIRTDTKQEKVLKTQIQEVKIKIVPNIVKTGASKRKTKNINNNNNIACVIAMAVPKVPRRSIHAPKWSNGWSWEGDSYQGKIFLNSDEALIIRTCYPAMRHIEGDLITPRDSVLLKAGPRKTDLPFVAKVAALWENPEDGEMMMSLLWYYRPEHTEQGRSDLDQQDEVFASRHKDTNSVACIEDKCYVLTFNEYCRYRKTVRRLDEGLEPTGPIVPLPDGGQYHRAHRQPPVSPECALSPDLVFFCRRVYDFRQKRLVKNPS